MCCRQVPELCFALDWLSQLTQPPWLHSLHQLFFTSQRACALVSQDYLMHLAKCISVQLILRNLATVRQCCHLGHITAVAILGSEALMRLRAGIYTNSSRMLSSRL